MLRPTIRNKLVGGFGALLLLMAVVAVIGCRAVLELRASALETARVGDRLDSISLEIQVHNLEAQQRINGYLANFKQVGADKARELYLDEAQFEIHEIQSLATKGVKIARTDEKKTKFHLIVQASSDYSDAVDAVVQSVESKSQVDANTLAKYQSTSQHLNETAEDGEMAGRDASQTSQDRIEQIQQDLRAHGHRCIPPGPRNRAGDEHDLVARNLAACRSSERGRRKRKPRKSIDERASILRRRDR